MARWDISYFEKISFCHNIFKICLLQMRESTSVSGGKGLTYTDDSRNSIEGKLVKVNEELYTNYRIWKIWKYRIINVNWKSKSSFKTALLWKFIPSKENNAIQMHVYTNARLPAIKREICFSCRLKNKSSGKMIFLKMSKSY